MQLPHNDFGTRVQDQLMAAGAGPIYIALPTLDEAQLANRGIGETLAKQYLVRQGARPRRLRAAASDAVDVAQWLSRFIS